MLVTVGLAVLALGESSVEARVVATVRAGEQFAAEREIRRRVTERFAARGIEIPGPRRTVTVRAEPGAALPPGAAAA